MTSLQPIHRIGCAIALILLFGSVVATAQEDAAKPQEELAATEKSLAEQFDRLELLAGRLAELSKATQPRRAELLQQLVAQSREKDVPGRFKKIVAALEKDDLGDAATGQTSLHADLQAMLELLLQEDRDRQLESERQRVAKYLADLNKIIRQQRGIRARTAGGDSEQQLSEDQQRAADNAEELSDKIEASEVKPKQGSLSEQSESGKAPDPSKVGDPSKAGEPSDSQQAEKDSSPQEGGQNPAEGSQPKDSQQPNGKPNDSQQEAEPKESQQGESQPSESQPSDSSQGESQPGESPQGQSQPGQSQSQPSQGGDPSQSQQQAQQQSPSERAVEKLRKAQQRMQQAQEKLEQAKRHEALPEQEQALRELEQAKAELEKILRQLREEEMERMLVLLEARLRKMLEMQNDVYDLTIKLAESVNNVPEHELEIASASLGRKEDQIVGEADRALVLMREDGSSVAFPEAIQQAREDMRTVAGRLRSVQTDEVTQALEEDIIATLEETLAALQQALKDLRDQKASQQGQSGEPGEQPLVDQLAELRMIRALQGRVNRRTEFYDRLIKGDQTREAELLESLRQLAERQERIFDATRDLHQGTNQ